jgi:hypothetical protein
VSSIAARFRDGHARAAALAALCAILFLTFLDNTIVSVALADMQTSLKAGVSSLQWIVDGYMLAFAARQCVGPFSSQELSQLYPTSSLTVSTTNLRIGHAL